MKGEWRGTTISSTCGTNTGAEDGGNIAAVGAERKSSTALSNGSKIIYLFMYLSVCPFFITFYFKVKGELSSARAAEDSDGIISVVFHQRLP